LRAGRNEQGGNKCSWYLAELDLFTFFRMARIVFLSIRPALMPGGGI
jgi:hypothetical protein